MITAVMCKCQIVCANDVRCRSFYATSVRLCKRANVCHASSPMFPLFSDAASRASVCLQNHLSVLPSKRHFLTPCSSLPLHACKCFRDSPSPLFLDAASRASVLPAKPSISPFTLISPPSLAGGFTTQFTRTLSLLTSLMHESRW